jgi:hypothetical protein
MMVVLAQDSAGNQVVGRGLQDRNRDDADSLLQRNIYSPWGVFKVGARISNNDECLPPGWSVADARKESHEDVA